MKKIIIYGVRCNRSLFERELNNNYEIIGYTDGDIRYSELNTYDYKPFYQLNQLIHVAYDFIVILVTKEVQINLIYNNLLENKVDIKKIIRWGSFSQCDYRNPMKEYRNLKRDFSGYVFGMSHAYNGFLTHWFSESLFKFASPSADLFINMKYIEFLKKEKLNNKLNIKYFIFDFPYYIFNFDLSKFPQYMKIRMNYFEILNDYHNFKDEQLITEFKEVCKMRNKSDYIIPSNNFENFSQTSLSNEEMLEIINKESYVWYQITQETIKENLLLWENIVNTINEINEKAKIIIVIFPHNPDFISRHSDAITNMKRVFYDNINSKKDNNIKVLDYYQIDYLPEDFIDNYHLCGEKCVEFSKFLNREFEKKIY